jgi:hypothetical protein
MPADEVVLIYTTISISSTCEAAQVAALDAELAELEGPAGFGCAQVRRHRVSLFGQQFLQKACWGQGDQHTASNFVC